ncbi:MAG: NAD(P)H-hydrate dehydratase, partial [Planctomycetota bacterium]
MSTKAAALMNDLPPLPPRPTDGHKGTFGTVLVLGGCDADGQVMIGAPALTALGALRTGCGLVKLAMPASVLASAIVMTPGATGVPLPQGEDGVLRPSAVASTVDEAIETGRISALALGPGMGIGFEQQQVLIRLTAQDEVPLVIDADGLNNLAETPEFDADLRAEAVLTPHPGEFARLARALDLDADPKDPKRREAAAELLAQRLGCVVVLKGADTVVTNGAQTWVARYANPVLATAGTGDVLTGVIASLI